LIINFLFKENINFRFFFHDKLNNLYLTKHYYLVYFYEKINCLVIYKNLLPILALLIISHNYLFAQSDIYELNFVAQPEIELIIGLNQPNKDHEILLMETPVDLIDEVIDENEVIDNSIDIDVADGNSEEDLQDLLDELEDIDNPSSEPGKEELILVKELHDLDINIYPNPAKDYVKLQIDKTDDYQIVMYDLIGNKVLSEIHSVEFGSELKFDLSNFQTGVYVMYIRTKETTTIKKFALKH